MSFSTNKQKLATVTGTAYTVANDVGTVVVNSANPTTLTLPSASAYSNREIRVLNETSNAVTSASANVVPLAGGSATTAIAPAAGSHLLKSNGTNWLLVA